MDGFILRGESILHAISKLKRGGLVVFDYANNFLLNTFGGSVRTVAHYRTDYHTDVWRQVYEALRNWRGMTGSNGIFETRFWFKPTS